MADIKTIKQSARSAGNTTVTQSEAAISMDTVFRHIKNSRRCLENRKDGCSVE